MLLGVVFTWKGRTGGPGTVELESLKDYLLEDVAKKPQGPQGTPESLTGPEDRKQRDGLLLGIFYISITLDLLHISLKLTICCSFQSWNSYRTPKSPRNGFNGSRKPGKQHILHMKPALLAFSHVLNYLVHVKEILG